MTSTLRNYFNQFTLLGVRVTEDLMIALFWSHLWTSIASLFRTLKLSRLICDWNTNAVVNVKSKEVRLPIIHMTTYMKFLLIQRINKESFIRCSYD